MCSVFFFFEQKTAYEMRIRDWSSDVFSSALVRVAVCRMPLLPLDPIKGLSMPRWAWTGRTGGRTEVERSPWGRVASETGQRVRRWVAIDAPVPARVAADEGRDRKSTRLNSSH